MSPFFTILIPTYNQAQYLGEALDSIIAQTDLDWEAIIVNDGSTDNTAQIIEAYCRKEPRFIAIHKPNGGTGSALNVGLKKAQGKWVCWLSSDDMFEVNKLEIHRQWINRNPESKFFFSDFRQLVGTTGEVTNFNPDLRLYIPPLEFQIIRLMQGNYIAGNSICIFREDWLSVGYFNEELRYAQDYDMWIRLSLRYPAIFIPEYTYLQRVYPEQESQRFSDFCLYDSAKAVTNLLNSHSLQDIFPFISLDNKENVVKAIRELIDLAFSLRSQMYQLGFHPLLIIKIKNFLNDYSQYNDELDLLLASKLQEKSKLLKGSLVGLWCSFCYNLYYDKEKNSDKNFKHTWDFIVSFKHIGLTYYLWLYNIQLNENLSDASSIAKYLSKSYHVDVFTLDKTTRSYVQILNEVVNIRAANQQELYSQCVSQNIDVEDYINCSFIDKIKLLERLDYPLECIYSVIIKQYRYPTKKLIVLFIYIQRSFRLISQGVFWFRLREYFKYVKRQKL